MHQWKLAAVACAATVGAWSVNAWAVECTPPGPPPPQSARPSYPGQAPPLPPCVNEAKHTQNCRHGEIARFNADVEAFNRQVDDFNKASSAYIDALNAWGSAVSDYSRCEVNKLNASIPRH